MPDVLIGVVLKASLLTCSGAIALHFIWCCRSGLPWWDRIETPKRRDMPTGRRPVATWSRKLIPALPRFVR